MCCERPEQRAANRPRASRIRPGFPAGSFHPAIGVYRSFTDFSGWHMSLLLDAARLALPGKEHTSMIKLQSTAITRGPDPLRTRLASFSTVWPRETPSTPRAELGINGLRTLGRNLSRNV